MTCMFHLKAHCRTKDFDTPTEYFLLNCALKYICKINLCLHEAESSELQYISVAYFDSNGNKFI